jgi:hypothetical protein
MALEDVPAMSGQSLFVPRLGCRVERRHMYDCAQRRPLGLEPGLFDAARLIEAKNGLQHCPIATHQWVEWSSTCQANTYPRTASGPSQGQVLRMRLCLADMFSRMCTMQVRRGRLA